MYQQSVKKTPKLNYCLNFSKWICNGNKNYAKWRAHEVNKSLTPRWLQQIISQCDWKAPKSVT